MATHPLLFDLGAAPTTRDARLVKSRGVSALPDAVRRGDDFASMIFVKTNFVDVLRRELRSAAGPVGPHELPRPHQRADGGRGSLGNARTRCGAPRTEAAGGSATGGCGVDCGVLMAPIVPGFSTQPAKLERTMKAIADSGATSVGAMVMHLDGGTRDHFMDFLGREYPEMVSRYDHLYAREYVPKDYSDRVQAVVSLMRARYLPRGGRSVPR